MEIMDVILRLVVVAAIVSIIEFAFSSFKKEKSSIEKRVIQSVLIGIALTLSLLLIDWIFTLSIILN